MMVLVHIEAISWYILTYIFTEIVPELFSLYCFFSANAKPIDDDVISASWAVLIAGI